MRTLPIALAGLLLAVAVAPAAAAQGPLPPNPFPTIAQCANPSGSGVVGYARMMVYLACTFVLGAGSVTYDFACYVVQGSC